MSEQVLKILNGYSGSLVELVQKDNDIMVRKTNNIHRNLERLQALEKLNLQTPRILEIGDNSYLMDYIPHTDVKSWLTKNSPQKLIDMIVSTITLFAANSTIKNYTTVYEEKLEPLFQSEWRNQLPFNTDSLIDRLPKFLPQSEYHGDFCLDNIVFHETQGFYLIDPLTSVYDSWVFDLAKLRQDLQCKWFLRHTTLALDAKLATIQEQLTKQYDFVDNPYLLVLMLCRILPYSTNPKDQQWLLTEIHKLWK
jgi:tRNA A-37 threonylcarbamoyl transferase component Bud32